MSKPTYSHVIGNGFRLELKLNLTITVDDHFETLK